VVKEVGEGVKHAKVGDKVIAFTTFGAFAEEVKTEAIRLLPLPEGMDFPSGASFILTYGTTDHALRDRGALREGETLLVLGAAGGSRHCGDRDRQGTRCARDRLRIERGEARGVPAARRGRNDQLCGRRPARADQGDHRRQGRRRDL
jgi:hypothetical protein